MRQSKHTLLGLILISTVLLFQFCRSHVNQQDQKAKAFPDGSYTGYFVRSSPLARYMPANVTLTFKDGRFSGQSEKTNYPAIGEGSFKVTGNQIEFTDERLWTANFDWTYILKGTYTFQVTGNKVEFSKVEGDITDHYELELTR